MSAESKILNLLRRRLIFGGLAAASLQLARAAEPVYDYGASPNVIDIGYGIFSTPMSVLGEVMRHDRILRSMAASKGLEFRFHRYEKGVDSLNPFLVDQLDAFMPTDVVALDALAKTDLIMLGYVRQSFSSVVGARGMSMLALRGKRVGNASGTSGHNALLQGLAGVGLSERDVVLEQMNVRDMPEALLAGRIDAFAAWEPTPSSFLKKHAGRYITLHRQISPAYLVIKRDLATRQLEAARLLAAALHRAVRWLARSRGNIELAGQWTLTEMQVFSGKVPDIPLKDIALLIRSDLLDIAGVPLIPMRETKPDSALGRSFEFFHRIGRLPGSMNWARVASSVDVTINRHVLDNGANYRLGEFEYAQ